ncbi:MAG: protease HtpX [Spirochaetota bacterium]
MLLRRIGFFLLTNFLIIFTISVITNLLGLRSYLGGSGLNYYALLFLCAIWGFAGSLISLVLSKSIAQSSMGVNLVSFRNPGEFKSILMMTHELSQKARIPMPELGVFVSPEVNAFATGASQDDSLVAVSTGLLQTMNAEEVKGVLAHEISHIANGDMVTMTLIQGTVNTFSLFLSRILGFVIGRGVSRDLEYMVRSLITFVLDILFSLLGSLVVAYYSRQREFRADYGGAKLAGKAGMIAALRRLQKSYKPLDKRGDSIATLKISGERISLFSTHPPLSERIAALQRAQLR